MLHNIFVLYYFCLSEESLLKRKKENETNFSLLSDFCSMEYIFCSHKNQIEEIFFHWNDFYSSQIIV